MCEFMLILFLLILIVVAYSVGRRYEQKKRIITYQFELNKESFNPKIKIPKVIYQTWKETSFDAIDTKTSVLMNSWRQLNMDWEYKLYGDDECREFVKEYHPDALAAYDMLPKPVERADFFRYLVILSFGGVYADVDCTCIKPIEEWIKADDGMVVGLEFPLKKNDENKKHYPFQTCAQWVFAAVPNHPILLDLKALILEEITSQKQPFGVSSIDTLTRTGPVIFTKAISRYIEKQGESYESYYEGGVIGDLRIHLKSILSHWPDKAHQDSCVLHGYEGSWRK